MKYNKKIFKQHYGKAYIDLIKIIVIIALITLIVILIRPENDVLLALIFILTAISSFGILLFIPLIFCYYIKAKKASERQKQWISNDILHVTIIPENGFTWGGFTYHTISYEVSKLTNVIETKRYMIIQGSISVKDNFNGIIKESYVSEFKLPRNFSNEKNITKLLGAIYG